MLGSDWHMRSAGEAKLEETAVISLRGSLLELQAVTDRLEALRSSAARRPDLCLRVWSEARQSYLYSPLKAFNWQVLPVHPRSAEGGSFRLELNWERENFFYGDELPVPLSNTSGSGLVSGITLYNHDDAAIGHDNWFDVNLQAIGNLWPLPLRVEVKTPTSGEPLADFWLGSMCLPDSGVLPNLVFEAESGLGGTVLTDASAIFGCVLSLRLERQRLA
jgi:hypothetical protein